jgi:hypothetical protein
VFGVTTGTKLAMEGATRNSIVDVTECCVPRQDEDD